MSEPSASGTVEAAGTDWLPRFAAPDVPRFRHSSLRRPPLDFAPFTARAVAAPPGTPAPALPPVPALTAAPTALHAPPPPPPPVPQRTSPHPRPHLHAPQLHAPHLPPPVAAPEAMPIVAEIARHSQSAARISVAKLPQVTALFWALKMTGTTLGETAGDFISEGLHLGYLLTFFLVMAWFLASVSAQVRRGELVPWLYWTVIVATSMAGTEMADFIFHTLGIGVRSIALGFIAPVIVIYLLGRFTGGSFSVSDINSRRDEILYWSLILTSNTIGTALGDGLGVTPLGVLGSTILISMVMGGILLLHARTSVSRVALFWAAFVLTRPLGATGGDLLWKPQAEGGLGLGRVAVSLVLIAIMVLLVRVATRNLDARRTREALAPA